MPPSVEPSYLRPAFLTAALGAVLSLLVSAGFVLVSGGSSGSSLISLARATARTWLVAVGSGIDAGSVSFGLVPIGATLLCVVLVARAAAWVVGEPLDDLAAYTATTAGAYGVIAVIASAASASGDVSTSVVRAAVGAFLVGGLGAAWGVTRRHGQAERFWFTVSDDVRLATRAAVPGVVVVLASAAAIVIVQLARNVDRAGDIWARLDPGTGGGVALLAGCLLAVPTLVLWTASVLIGPGFMLGTDTSVDLSGSQLGNVPGFPMLAALPSPGSFPAWVAVLGVVPLLAGMVAGWRVAPGRRDGVTARVALGAAAGAIAGFVLGVLVGVSGGAVGPGRMADAGPSVLTPLLVAVPVMAVGGALGAALAHYRGDRASQPADASSTGRPSLWRRHQPAGAARRGSKS
ncbi:DUF6350 family protein [Aeromicrobium sp. A1-2]|uniref:cell division protein PerM n=1 Tax=Aeromicrobium sp. A1-2 TaxID=2107713 RepID=UPI0013C2CB83|nr:DUF6350 family protein [Aeromicrobium sp. A1-2]